MGSTGAASVAASAPDSVTHAAEGGAGAKRGSPLRIGPDTPRLGDLAAGSAAFAEPSLGAAGNAARMAAELAQPGGGHRAHAASCFAPQAAAGRSGATRGGGGGGHVMSRFAPPAAANHLTAPSGVGGGGYAKSRFAPRDAPAGGVPAAPRRDGDCSVPAAAGGVSWGYSGAGAAPGSQRFAAYMSDISGALGDDDEDGAAAGLEESLREKGAGKKVTGEAAEGQTVEWGEGEEPKGDVKKRGLETSLLEEGGVVRDQKRRRRVES